MAFNAVQSVLGGLQVRQQQQQNEAQMLQQQQQAQQFAAQQQLAAAAGQQGFNPAFSPELQQSAALSSNPLEAFSRLDTRRQKSFFADAEKGLKFAQEGKFDKIAALAEKRLKNINKSGGDPTDTMAIIDGLANRDFDGVTQMLQTGVEAGIKHGFLVDPAELDLKRREREARIASLGRTSGRAGDFERRTQGLTEEQKIQAQLVDLGLSPRAVGSAIQTISAKGIAEQIGDVKATIKGREKFGELTGASRAKRIDLGFNKINTINSGIRNIDRAIALLGEGAGVGAIEKFFPSFKAASVGLDNLQKTMALDVVGSTTFGALSAPELDLAKQVALPTGLDTPALIKHLNDRKAAQGKLRDYYNEQIQFLDQGGTIAGFLRQKERDTTGGGQFAQPSALQSTQQPAQQQGGQIMIDADGNRAMVFPDGTFEEL